MERATRKIGSAHRDQHREAVRAHQRGLPGEDTPPVVADQHPLSLMWRQFGLKLTDVTRAFGASNQRMYQLYAKGDPHGRVLSAIRRAAISKGYSATDVDERLAAIRLDRPSIIEHVLRAHRDDLRAAAENLSGVLGDMPVL